MTNPVSEIDPVLVGKMAALVRDIADFTWSDGLLAGNASRNQDAAFAARLCEIARLLPKPIDPDLLEARRMVALRSGNAEIEAEYRLRVMDGAEDGHPAVINTLAAIKRGRELAEQDGPK